MNLSEEWVYPWQQSLWQRLWQQRANHRLPHALLLSGNPGLGKKHFARVVAKSVLCLERNEWACGRCRSCRWFSAGSHPDFLSVSEENSAAIIKVDAIRTLTEMLHLTPQCSTYRVAIIYPAGAMNRAATNALLKTLEEPAGQALLMLVQHQSSYLPATVVSRCQRMVLTHTDARMAEAWLKAQRSMGDAEGWLLKMAYQAPLLALQWAELGYRPLRNQVLMGLWQLRRREVSPLMLAKQWSVHDPVVLLQIVLTLGMDIVRVQCHLGVEWLIHSDCLVQLRAFSALITPQSVLSWLQQGQAVLRILHESVRIQWLLWLESWLLSWEEGTTC